MGLNSPVPVSDLMQVYAAKYYRAGEPGWGPKQRLALGYFSADDHYEATVRRLLARGSEWADIGCGWSMFPQNPALAQELADRCVYLQGIDPDPNIHDNPYLSASFQGPIEEFRTERQFDLVTLRMVAEHISRPEAAVESIARITKPGGRVVVYTPNKWSPASLLAAITPFALHNPVKRLFWRSAPEDTFPTEYKLNTRADIERHFVASGFRLESFHYVDDCSVTSRFRRLNAVEIRISKMLRRMSLRHPENCLLAVLVKTEQSQCLQG